MANQGKLKRESSESSSASAFEDTTDSTSAENTPAADGAAAQGNAALSQADELKRQKRRDRDRAARAQKANVNQYKERRDDLVVVVDAPIPQDNFKSTDGQHVVRIIPNTKALYMDYRRVAGYLGLANTTEMKEIHDDDQVADIVEYLFQQDSQCWGIAPGLATWSHNKVIGAFSDDEGGVSQQLRTCLDQLNEGELWNPNHVDMVRTSPRVYTASVCTIGRAVGMIRLMQCQANLFKESRPAELRFSAEDINRAINLYRALSRGTPKQIKPAMLTQYAHPKDSSGPAPESDLILSQHSHASPAPDGGEDKVLKAIESLHDEMRDMHDSMRNEITGLRNDMAIVRNARKNTPPSSGTTLNDLINSSPPSHYV